MKTTLETLKRKFIKPNDSVTKFPVRDGYYWLQWPEREQRPDPRTGKPHMEVCQYEQGAVLLIGTREDYSKQMKGRTFRFFGPIALPFEAGTQ